MHAKDKGNLTLAVIVGLLLPSAQGAENLAGAMTRAESRRFKAGAQVFGENILS